MYHNCNNYEMCNIATLMNELHFQVESSNFNSYKLYEMCNIATFMNELHFQVESSNFNNYKLKKLGNCTTSNSIHCQHACLVRVGLQLQ